MAELREEQAGFSDAHTVAYMRPILSAAPVENRRALLLSHLQQNFGQVLRMEPTQIDENVALGSLGLDSLMGLEIRNRLEASLGRAIPTTALFEYPSAETLADHLLTPSVAVPPFPVEQNYPDTIAGKPMKTYIDWIAPTFVLSLTGLPVACVPAGLDSNGMPVGLQVAGKQFGEEAVLALSAQLQRLRPLPLRGPWAMVKGQ